MLNTNEIKVIKFAIFYFFEKILIDDVTDIYSTNKQSSPIAKFNNGTNAR
jgi:hypothetical protein